MSKLIQSDLGWVADVKVLSFDLDDTLWDCPPAIAGAEAALRDWFESNTPNVMALYSLETLQQRRELAVQAQPEISTDVTLLRHKMIEGLLVDAGYEATLADTAFDVFYKARSRVTLYPGTAEVLDALGKHYQLAVITNGNADLNLIGLADRFQHIQRASIENPPKPDSSMFRRCLEEFDIPANALAHIGDNAATDVGGGQSVGARTIWFNQAGLALSRIFYVNGSFVDEQDAKISVLDRGFLFADAVYEVSSVLGGKLIDNRAHTVRLHRSLNELSMAPPCSDEELLAHQHRLVELNQLEEGLLYMQVSRGVADRDFAYPANPQSSLVMFTQAKTLIDAPAASTGISVITVPDIRWQRRDIKTVGLLGPSMAKQQALNAGANDAWMVEAGYVTEGTSNNAYIVRDDNVIQTRHLGNEILSGITRAAVLKFARQEGFTVVEEPFTVQQAIAANEAFFTSASSFVMPVVSIDGHDIGSGQPGPVASRLREIYIETAIARGDL